MSITPIVLFAIALAAVSFFAAMAFAMVTFGRRGKAYREAYLTHVRQRSRVDSKSFAVGERRHVQLRDFVYLDADKLYSFYSQVFEGVADEIVDSHIANLSSRTRQSESPWSKESLSTEVAELSQRVESRVLYDHMYNQLEERLGKAIDLPADLSAANVREKLAGTFLVKVHGPAEIDDYDRFEEFTNRFNELGEAIAYARTISDEGRAAIEQLSQSISDIRDRNEQARVRQQLKHLSDPKALAKELGLQQDDRTLASLRVWNEIFRRNCLEVAVKAGPDVDDIVFRAVVDKRSLRTDSDKLRLLYGGAVLSPWTMVGQITYLPGDGSLADKEFAVPQSSEPPDPNQPSMRDPFRTMFLASRVLERMFFESPTRTEVTVQPLAIYREARSPLPDS